MTAVIVVESCFGSTRAAAQEIARGLRDDGVPARVLSPGQATGEALAGAGLVVLGAPTHNRGLPTTASLAKAAAAGGDDGAERAGGPAGRSMREWLATAPIPPQARVAAFDTVTGRSWLHGSAARQILKALGRRRAPMRSLVVTGTQGPLAQGEAQAARAWGAELARP